MATHNNIPISKGCTSDALLKKLSVKFITISPPKTKTSENWNLETKEWMANYYTWY